MFYKNKHLKRFFLLKTAGEGLQQSRVSIIHFIHKYLNSEQDE